MLPKQSIALATTLWMALSGCGGFDGTQVVVCLYLEPVTRARATELRVQVLDAAGNERARFVESPLALGGPARIPVIPNADGARFTLVAELADANGVFASRRVDARYEQGALLAHRVTFFDACLGMACASDEACTLDASGAAVCAPPDDALDIDERSLDAACPDDAGCPGCEGACVSCVRGMCLSKPEGTACGPCADDTCMAGRCDVVSPIATNNADPALSLGARHSCAVIRYAADDQDTFCFGANERGQLGIGSSSELETTPVREERRRQGVRSVGVGASHTCFSVYDGPAYCFGDGTRGQLARSVVVPTATTSDDAVDPSRDWRQVAAAADHTCAIDRDTRQLFCWGDASDAHAGLGCGLGDLLSADLVGAGADWSAIALGPNHGCGIRETDGRTLFCWGRNEEGQVDAGLEALVCEPAPIAGRGWTHVAVGGRHTCGAIDGSVRCWGSDDNGQRGDGETNDGVVAFAFEQLQALGAGDAHTCALQSDGQLFCWGANDRGQLGVDRPNADAPAQVPGRYLALALGAEHTCAADTEQRLFCWGRNELGQLGVGDTTDRAAPTRVCVPETRR